MEDIPPLIGAAVLLVFAVAFVLIVRRWWRTGMGSRFYFSTGLLREGAITPAFICVVMLAGSWIMADGRPLAVILTAGALYAVCAVLCYTLGFVRGALRRRRSEGIIGAKLG